MVDVSVVIPAFNAGRLLERAIESVLSQTFSDVECIVVDDGSSEDLEWVTDLPDPRVVLHRQTNLGPSVARNVGVSVSRSPTIAFLDADDEWAPHKLERQRAAMAAHPGASLWHTGFSWESEAASVVGDASPVTFHGLLADQHICMSSVVVRKDLYWAVGGHDPQLRYAEDYDFCLRLAALFGDPCVIDEVLVKHHEHSANATRDYAAAERGRRLVLEKHRRCAELAGDRATASAADAGLRRTKELYAAQAVDRARSARRSGEVRQAMRHLSRAARLSPSVGVGAVLKAVRPRRP